MSLIKAYKKTLQANKGLNISYSGSIFNIFCRYISNFFVPIFVWFKFSATAVTFLSFITINISCAFIITNQFIFGVIFFFIFRILDFVDGSVARINKNASLSGKFLDSMVDIYGRGAVLISVGYFISKIYLSENLFYLGIISGMSSIMYNLIYDKFSALVRWANEEQKKKYAPYIRGKKDGNIAARLDDIYYLSLLISPFFYFDTLIFKILIMLCLVTNVILFIFNFCLHLFQINSYLKK
ncbi:CDP-alcohol phosphatidyltransferase family protein [Pelagibacteraceae bacterium]|nr:CDP-alcohol phosphatidyltransferase family protein [Pelagibacteraceae bacterium]